MPHQSWIKTLGLWAIEVSSLGEGVGTEFHHVASDSVNHL